MKQNRKFQNTAEGGQNSSYLKLFMETITNILEKYETIMQIKSKKKEATIHRHY